MSDNKKPQGAAGAALLGLIAAIVAAVLFFAVAKEQQLVSLVIRANPAGATVRLVEPRMDAEYPTEQRATTGEVEFGNLPGGKHAKLTVSGKGYQQEVLEVQLPSEGSKTVSVRLKAEGALYKVRSDPEGALLYLDNKPAGIAPTVLTDVPSGPHELTAHLEGYEKTSLSFTATAGDNKELQLKLVPLPERDAGPEATATAPDAVPDGRARLEATSTHRARFFVDNFVMGFGMSAARYVAPGSYRVAASAEGRATKWRVIEIAEGERKTVAFEFNEDPLEKALDATDPSKPVYWTIRGGNIRNDGQYGSAVDMFKKALELDPNDVVSHRQLSRTYPALKLWDEAIEHAEKYLELSPGAPDAKFTRELIEEFKARRDAGKSP